MEVADEHHLVRHCIETACDFVPGNRSTTQVPDVGKILGIQPGLDMREMALAKLQAWLKT